MTRKNESGFTLVELSIVLIIIGLIVGGVLAGQSIIKSAKLQAEITQYNQLNASVNAFALKYGALPGDMTNPTNYWSAAYFPYAAGNNGFGNGDGFISCGNDNWFADLGLINVEQPLANGELALAGLLNRVCPPNTTACFADGSSIDASGLAEDAPGPGGLLIPAKIAGGAVFYSGGGNSTGCNIANNIGSGGPFNWVRYGLNTDLGAGDGFGGLLLQPLYTPDQVASIDNKLDDGNATTGIVQSRGAGAATLDTPGSQGAAGTGKCNTAAGVYNSSDNLAECGFAIRLSQ